MCKHLQGVNISLIHRQHAKLYKEIIWAHIVNFQLCITPFCPHLNPNFTCNLETKSFYNFSSTRVLNPGPTGNMSAALPSELSGHIDIICSITIWTSQCMLDVHYISAGVNAIPAFNTYFFQAVRCHASINILVKWHLAITERNQSTYSNTRVLLKQGGGIPNVQTPTRCQH